MKIKILMIIAILALCFSAGAKTPPNAADGQHATVYLFRPKALPGMFWNYKVFVNGKKVKVKNNSSYEVTLKSGETNVEIRRGRKNKMKFEVEAGKEYYFQTYIRLGLFAGVFEIAEVTERFGHNKMSKMNESNKYHVQL